MVAPLTLWEACLTGRTRHRVSLFGKLVLQVEERRQRVILQGPMRSEPWGIGHNTWRDATRDDLYAHPELAHLQGRTA